ncbi:phosphoethanolamine transferase [Pseudidiomarina mangrovi]|uniref:phosphoethanolamine transferase n=1 Tax=Pseudidiomarina mangrovi TaxID=2487133 RepID=UPI0013E0CB2F|nr:phosphoethanolamine--lipid A transferase [Pseudidiomarina mangrovi]
MIKRPFNLKAWQVIIVISLWLTFTYNGALLYAMQEHYQLTSAAPVIALTAVMLLLNGLFATLMIWPKIWRFSVAVVVFSSALALYFQQHYGILIDADMLINVLETDASESSSLVTLSLLFTCVLWGVVPSLLLRLITIEWPSRKRHVVLHHTLLLSALLVGLMSVIMVWYQPLASLVRNHRELKHQVIPVNWVSAAVSVANSQFHSAPSYIDLTATAEKISTMTATNHRVLVLVIGETARADHFSINGYARDTTPRLKQLSEQHKLINFGAIAACGTATATSVPCLLSYQTREAFDPESARNSSNVLDIAQAAGYSVIWIDNNSGCKDMCNRVATVNTSDHRDDPLCVDSDYCNDGILVKQLQHQLAHISSDTVIVLHMIGSHGPAYYRRSLPSDKIFSPECTSSNFEQCSTAELVNSYDNSLRTTDDVIADSIAVLNNSTYESALLYVSDHGESLGENGTYLHGMPYWLAPAAQREVPMVLWLSDSYAQQTQLRPECLSPSADQALSHDHIFHSFLGLLQVTSSLYRASLDVTTWCG